MALLDAERGWIVIRVVYDGPPEAGKTTSLRALAGSLGRPLYVPEEQDGRTLYFDWVDYVGGRYEGYQIRCQIVSVPGQPHLAERRRVLLAEADVIVFVADSARAQLGATLKLLSELPALLPVAPPPVGVILQANKRDLPDAVPLGELRAATDSAGWNVGVVESVASEGTGIRETFVFAVRLALDRVRELLRTGALARGRPEVDDGEALLARMRSVEVAAAKQAMSAAMAAAAKNGNGNSHGISNGNGSAVAESLAVPALRQVLAENEAAAVVAAHRKRAKNAGSPRPPDPSAPSGAIWPPVEGRMILHEAAASQMAVQVVGQGDWASEVGSGWRAYSCGDAVYRDLERGREMLIQWARLHVACTGFLSPRRCVVVADAGDGTWRLWQIVRAEPSLRDYLAGIERRDADEATARLLESASVLLDVGAKLAQASCPLPCTLDTIGRGEHGPIYIGLMPMKPYNDSHDEASDTRKIEREPSIEAELELIVYDALYGRRGEVLAAVERARRRTAASRGTQLIDRLLGRVSPS